MASYRHVFVVLLSVVVAVTGCSSYTFHGTQFNPPPAAADLALTNQDGQPVRLSDYRGKLVLLFFGYTHCPDVCPATFAKWKQVRHLLKDDAGQVRFVFISVDPERDTPERLKQHLALFDPTFIGLTGAPGDIEVATRAYGVYFKKVEAGSASGYLVDHTARTYVIDREGRLVLTFPFEAEPQDIAADLKYLLESQ